MSNPFANKASKAPAQTPATQQPAFSGGNSNPFGSMGEKDADRFPEIGDGYAVRLKLTSFRVVPATQFYGARVFFEGTLIEQFAGAAPLKVGATYSHKIAGFDGPGAKAAGRQLTAAFNAIFPELMADVALEDRPMVPQAVADASRPEVAEGSEAFDIRGREVLVQVTQLTSKAGRPFLAGEYLPVQ